MDKGAARDGMKTDVDAIGNIKELWDDLIRNDKMPSSNFVVFTHDGSKYILVGSGNGIEAMKGVVKKDLIHFIGLKVIVSGKPRFFHILFIGESVSAVKKGKAQILKSAPFNAMEGANGGEIAYPIGEEMNIDTLLSLIQKAVGKDSKPIELV